MNLDDHSESFKAGRFLDTIGFASFDIKTDNADIDTDTDIDIDNITVPSSSECK